MILSTLGISSRDFALGFPTWGLPSSNTSPSNKVRLPLIEAPLLWSLSHFLLPSRRLYPFSFGVLCSIFVDLLTWPTPFLLEFFVRYLRIYQLGRPLFFWSSLIDIWGFTMAPFLLEFFVRYLRIYQSIEMTKFRAWLWYHVRRTRLSTMVWYCPLWA